MVLIYFDLTTDSNYLLAFDQMQKLRHDKEFLSETFPGIAFEMETRHHYIFFLKIRAFVDQKMHEF